VTEDDQISLAAPLLEPPLPSESPSSGVGSLFGSEDMAITASKLSIAEGMLHLVTQDYSFHDFTRELLLSIIRVIKVEAGTIFELDYTTNHLFFRAVSGQVSDTVTKFTIPIGQGIVGHVAESRQPMVVDNVAENAKHIRAISAAVGYEARNIVAVPIVVRGRVYGVLELLNKIGEGGFGPSEVELLQYVCSLAAKAIEVRLMIGWTLQKIESDQQNRKEAA